MDIYQVAIAMENDLEKFYREQAKINQDNGLHTVFDLLADEEENHAKILKANMDKFQVPLDESNILSKVKPIFKDMANLSSDIKDIPSQLDAYNLALEKEEESINYYGKLYNESESEQAKTVIKYLIDQEKKHHTLLLELIKLVQRPEEWVEDAEFGIREDY